MENQLQTIINDTLGASIRIITINHEPWIVGKDVCDFLGFGNSKDALARHVDEEDKLLVDRNTVRELYENPGLQRVIDRNNGYVPAPFANGITDDRSEIPTRPSNGVSITVINESGFYSLVLRSNKQPEAKKFKRWVTSKVLPSIRKYGYYSSYHKNLDKYFEDSLKHIKVGDEICIPTANDIYGIGELAQSISNVYKVDFDIALLHATELKNKEWKCLDGIRNALIERMSGSQTLLAISNEDSKEI